MRVATAFDMCLGAEHARCRPFWRLHPLEKLEAGGR